MLTRCHVLEASDQCPPSTRTSGIRSLRCSTEMQARGVARHTTWRDHRDWGRSFASTAAHRKRVSFLRNRAVRAAVGRSTPSTRCDCRAIRSVGSTARGPLFEVKRPRPEIPPDGTSWCGPTTASSAVRRTASDGCGHCSGQLWVKRVAARIPEIRALAAPHPAPRPACGERGDVSVTRPFPPHLAPTARRAGRCGPRTAGR